MAEESPSSEQANKPERYQELEKQVRSLLSGESDPIARMANLCAAISDSFDFHWTGFYRVVGDELVLGPFQGPVACSRIAYGKGVCGTAWKENRSIIVDDVDAFPGHIACSAFSRSELVVPVRSNGRIIAVLDLDSDRISGFDETDRIGMERLVELLEATS